MTPSRFLAATVVLSLATAAPCLADERPVETLALGAAAPATTIKMKNVDGRELSFADVAGPKGTLVIFTCNSCPWVKAWEERIAGLGNRYARRGIGVIAINPNDPARSEEDGYEAMRARARQRGMRFPYVVDATSDVARAYGATRTPEVFLFDVEQRLVYRGTIDDNAKQPGKVRRQFLRDALEALLAGTAVAVQETKALGCAIKFRPKA